MSVLNLDKLLKPQSVALIGASRRENAVGNVVMKNLLDAGFYGSILPVNPGAKTVRGVFAYPDISSLPMTPDLAVVCTPAKTVPGIIQELGQIGTRAAVVISAGLDSGLRQQMLNAAREFGLRILGPNCVGLLVSGIGLNASFAHTDTLSGHLALLSQSGALCTTILDWAKSRGIGFSHFISMGDAADVDFGDLLDYLGSDAQTHGILMYVESLNEARKFISAARATARNKKVIVVKAGRFAEGAKAAASHTGALAGNDEVFDAAIRRAGMLRVYGIDDLFTAVETLANARPVSGRRLVILTNGGGTGVLATDHLIAHKGSLAELTSETVEALDKVLPANWSRANPVDIIGDSDAARYVAALRILMKDSNYDAILVMLVPSAVINNEEVARAVAAEIANVSKPVLTCWMGETAVSQARQIFQDAAIPSYETPAAAIKAFMHMVDYEQNQRTLIETPASMPEGFVPDKDHVHTLINEVLSQKRTLLTEPEAKQLLHDYQIPIVETIIAGNVEEAVAAADKLGFPVALKILSRDISHKSDVGGVLLGIESCDSLKREADAMAARIRTSLPDADIEGFTVQKMVQRPQAHELIVGVSTDPIFGPVILFGHGGTSVEVVNDKAIALPPLNMALASQLISQTRISKILAGYRDIKPVALEQLQLTLVKISQLVADQPQIIELDINPLLADADGVIALDARVVVQEPGPGHTDRLAIRPYPQELEEKLVVNDLEVFIRPIRPEDELMHRDFFKSLSMEDLYFRFFRAVDKLSHEQLARFTQIDYDREMAFIATRKGDSGEPETLGVVRAVSDADNIEAEFAIIIRSDFHRKGLGIALMRKIVDYCRARNTRRLLGQTLSSNHAMQNLARRFGFEVKNVAEEGIAKLELNLQDA